MERTLASWRTIAYHLVFDAIRIEEIEPPARIVVVVTERLQARGRLSLDRCALYNPGDRAARAEAGPRFLLGDRAQDFAENGAPVCRMRSADRPSR
jgi:hypothetical protein